jgi:hypothetical protein
MTEEEWKVCDEWLPLLIRIGRVPQRKATLYVCAGLRCIWEWLYDDASRQAVELAEREADGLATAEERDFASYLAEVPTFGYDFEARYVRDQPSKLGSFSSEVRRLLEMGVYSELDLQSDGPLGDEQVRSSLKNAAHIAYHNLGERLVNGRLHEHLLEHLRSQSQWPGAWLVRELFPNPYHPVEVEAHCLGWKDGTIQRLAEAAYQDRALPAGRLVSDHLAVLADALEDASCTEPAILDHLRSPGPHYRGCWVIDALLHKS